MATPGDDPRMKAAEKEAMSRWPEFVAAFNRRQPNEVLAAKGKFTDSNGTEWIWIDVSSISPDAVTGKIDNDPVTVHSVKCGDVVTVNLPNIDDWMYQDNSGMHGGFTSRVLMKIENEKQGKAQ